MPRHARATRAAGARSLPRRTSQSCRARCAQRRPRREARQGARALDRGAGGVYSQIKFDCSHARDDHRAFLRPSSASCVELRSGVSTRKRPARLLPPVLRGRRRCMLVSSSVDDLAGRRALCREQHPQAPLLTAAASRCGVVGAPLGRMMGVTALMRVGETWRPRRWASLVGIPRALPPPSLVVCQVRAPCAASGRGGERCLPGGCAPHFAACRSAAVAVRRGCCAAAARNPLRLASRAHTCAATPCGSGTQRPQRAHAGWAHACWARGRLVGGASCCWP